MRRAGIIFVLVIGALAWAGSAAMAAVPTVISTSDPFDRFVPAKVTIKPGGTVKWHNQDGKHNVHFQNGTKIGGLPGTHTASSNNWDAQRTFNTAGTYRYWCDEHSDSTGSYGMVGRVVVDGKLPVISNLRTEPAAFCTNKSQNCTKRGTKIKFTLSEAAKVTGDVKRDKPNAPRIQIFANKQLSAGARSIDYSGKDRVPGVYVLRLRAKDAAGNLSAFKTTKFTVKP